MPDVMVLNGRGTFGQELGDTAHDLRQSISRFRLAFALAWHDIVSRYRGSILGPIWISISMAAFVVGVGTLYSQLFGLSLRELVPYVAVGLVVWTFVSGTIAEGCDMYIGAAPLLRQTAMPMFLFVWRTVLRTLLYLAHHVIIIVLVLGAFNMLADANYLLAFLGLAVVTVNVAWIALMVAIVSSRFRDVPQIVATLLQFSLFLTPVFWRAEGGLARSAVVEFNPFFYMIDVVRGPLLQEPMHPSAWPLLLTFAVLGWVAAFVLFTKTRRRLVHYL